MSGDVVSCPSPRELALFLEGQLDEGRIESVGSHVESCSVCQRRIEELDEGAFDATIGRPDDLPFADESQCGRVVDQIAGRGATSKAAAVQPRPARTPKRLGDYELLERLGEGGMGTVYRGRHATLGTPAAVKILHPHRQADLATIERFEREMVALGKLNHPHIVRALDAGEESGLHYLVMEFVDGVDLGRVAKAHVKLNVADAAEVVRQAALGLSYVHQHGRVHRDVKPSNLILAADGTVKLLDLGLARVEEYPIDEAVGGGSDDILGASTADLTRTHQVMGTLEYMSPEQAADSHSVDHRADVYALGCTMYKLLTGHSPFASTRSISGLSQLLAHVETPAPAVAQLREDVPRGLSDLLDRMLAKRKEDRPQSAEEIAAALVPYCQQAQLADLATSTGSSSGGSPDNSLAPTVISSSAGSTARSNERILPALQTATRNTVVAIAAVVILGTVVTASLLFSHALASRGTVIVQVESPEVAAVLAQSDVKLNGAGESFTIGAGPMELPVGDYSVVGTADSALAFSPRRLKLAKNQQLVLSVELSPTRLPGRVAARVSKESEQPSDEKDSIPEAVDLMVLIDPDRDIRGNEWTLTDGQLVSDPDQPSMLVIPYQPPEQYRLELIATRLQDDESLQLGLAAGDDPVMLVVDGFPAEGSLSGLYKVDGAGLPKQSSGVHRGKLLPLMRPVSIVVMVDHSGNRVSVEMTVDGERITAWRGQKSQVNRTGSFSPPEPGMLFLANWTAAIRIEQLRVIPLAGEGRVVEFADPAEDPVLAAAQLAVWKGGAVSLLDEDALPTNTPPAAIGGFELLRQFEGHTGPVKSVALSPDGRLAASGSGWPSGDQTVRVWEVETGRLVHTLDAGFNVMHVTFSRNGRSLLAAGISTDLILWDVETGQRIRSYTPGAEAKFEEAAFTPDGSRIIASAGRERVLFVLDAETGEVIHRLAQPHDALSFAVTPDSRQLAISQGDGSIRVMDLESGSQLQQLDGPATIRNPMIYSVGISPSGRYLAAGFTEYTIRLWDLQTGTFWKDLRPPVVKQEAVAFTPDGRRIVASGPQGITSLIDLESGEIIGTTPQLLGHGWTLALAPDGRTVLTGGGLKYDKRFKPNGDYVLRLWRVGAAESGSSTNAPPLPQPTVLIDRLADIPANPRIVAIDMQASRWLRDQDVDLFTGLSDLQSLDLSGTRVTADAVNELRELPKLEFLGLARTGVDQISTMLAEQVPALIRIDLSGAPLADAALGALANFPMLRAVNLASTPVSDESLTSIHSIAMLEQFDLSGTAITSAGLAELPDFPKLNQLNLAGTSVDTVDSLTHDRFPLLSHINLLGTRGSRESIARLQAAFPQANILSSFTPIDLISLIDGQRDSLNLAWEKNGSVLEVPGASRLALPIRLPGEFELEMAVAKRTGRSGVSPELELPLPDGTKVMVGFDHRPERGAYAIIHGVDGQMEMDSPAKAQGRVVPLESDTPTWLKVRVEGSGETIRISLHADGSEIVAWEGNRNRLDPEFYGTPSDSRRPTIGLPGRSNQVSIRAMTLTPLSGQVELPSPGPSHTDPDRAVAQWVLRQGGFVKIHLVSGQRWNLARIDSIGELPDYPIRVAEIGGLSDRALSRDWLAKVGKMQELHVLGLNATRFNNADLAPLVGATSLRVVTCWKSTLNDQGLGYLAQLPKLEKITVGDSLVTAEGVAVLRDHPTLTEVGVGIMRGDQRICVDLATLANLRKLNLYQLPVTGEWLRHLVALKSLTRLEMRNCESLNDQDMAIVAEFPGLQELIATSGNLGPESMKPVARMASLRVLDVWRNPIGDGGVAQLEGLRHLTELRLGETGVSDRSLPVIARFPELRVLSLTGLTGITDAAVESLSRLKRLDQLMIDRTSITAAGVSRLRAALPQCQITKDSSVVVAQKLDLRGEDCDDQRLAQLVQTQYPTELTLGGAGITDDSIPTLLKLPLLTRLNLYGTRITESGVSQLTRLPELRRLEFWSMPQITGEVTKHLIEMPSLDHVIFKSTSVFGPGLERFQDQSLRGLNLGHSAFNREMLQRYILPLESLKVLDLAGCPVHDDDVELITEMQGIANLHLGFNTKLKGPGLVHIARMATLAGLNLDASAVDDEGLKWLRDATQLRSLWLAKTSVSDASIEVLSGLTGLRDLSLNETNFTVAGVDRLRGLMPGVNITASGIGGPQAEHVK